MENIISEICDLSSETQFYYNSSIINTLTDNQIITIFLHNSLGWSYKKVV